jgi:hypothetical protein
VFNIIPTVTHLSWRAVPGNCGSPPKKKAQFVTALGIAVNVLADFMLWGMRKAIFQKTVPRMMTSGALVIRRFLRTFA